MTTIGDIERVIAQLSPEQRARLQTLVESQSAPEPQPSAVVLAWNAQATAADTASREPRISRPARDLINWKPRPPQPVFSDPLAEYR
jgi:hypothetical protein